MKPEAELREDAEVRRHFRERLVSARAVALADGEAAEAVIFAIEHLGRFLARKDASLERLTTPIVEWVKRTLPERHEELDRRLQLLRRGRNERMHRGFAARDLTVDAVRVALILEEALRVDWDKLTAQDLMTPNPLEAKPWHTFGMVRDAMVANSYSHLPILWGGTWRLISERTVCRVVQQARCRTPPLDLRSVRLDADVPQLGGTLVDMLTNRATDTVRPETQATRLNLEHGCLLVVVGSDSPDGQPELEGIITPADVI